MAGRILDERLQLLMAGAFVFAVYALGVAWYRLVEGWTLLDAGFMAITTITTVGFSEVRPLDTSGRVFTMLYIPAGVGAVFYMVGVMVEQIVLGRVATVFGLQRSNRKIDRMHNHIVICGFGRVGEEVADELRERASQMLVIDRDPEVVERARRHGMLTVLGDATEEHVLREAHVDTARVLIAAADSDAGNTFMTLTARALNPGLFIIARAGTQAAEQHLTTAGADRVVSPYRFAGRRMALAAVQPLMVDFLDMFSRRGGEGRILAELQIGGDRQHLAGRSVAEAFGTVDGARVLGLERADGEFVGDPSGGVRLQPNDRVLLYGRPEALQRLTEA